MTKLLMASAACAALSAAPRPRGLIGMPRADASDPKALIAALNQAFEEFKTANEQKIAAKVDDALLDEKIDTINAAMSDLETSLNEKIAASSIVRGSDLPATSPDYLKAFKAHMRKGTEIGAEVMASVTVGTDSEGGLLAPIEWDRTVTDRLKQLSPIRANAQVIQITGRGFSRVYSDRIVGSGWVGETAARPATTTPGLTTLDFNTGEIYANPQISQQALDDVAIDLEQWITDEVDGEFAVQENIAFLSGNGVNKPSGILNFVAGGTMAATHPFGAIAAITAAGTAAVTSDELLDLVYAVPDERVAGAKFFLNKTTLAKVRKLKDTTNNYLWAPSMVAGEPATLLGYPVVSVPGMPAMAAGNVSVLFGNMEETYLVIDRIGLRVLRDPYTNKPFVGFYTTKRVGGGVQNPEYMKALVQAAA